MFMDIGFATLSLEKVHNIIGQWISETFNKVAIFTENIYTDQKVINDVITYEHWDIHFSYYFYLGVFYVLSNSINIYESEFQEEYDA
jgi:hypothetical protein